MTNQDIKKLAQVTEFRLKLYPKDFYLVRKFYEEELGYEVIEEWDKKESKGGMFDVAGVIIELLWPDPHNYDATKSADISLEVADVWSLFEAMKDKPYLVRGLKDNEWGDTSFFIKDPENFRITFFTKHK